MRLLPFLAVAALGTVQAAGNPAPLNGIWSLTGVSTASGNASHALSPAGQLVIVNGQLHGTYGCARFEGTLDAERNEASIGTRTLPHRANERCLFVIRNDLLSGLNAARQYTVSRTHLVLFSKSARLTFERIGYVTPVQK